jgi:hypothetical protein
MCNHSIICIMYMGYDQPDTDSDSDSDSDSDDGVDEFDPPILYFSLVMFTCLLHVFIHMYKHIFIYICTVYV